jgi:hypothetical protein
VRGVVGGWVCVQRLNEIHNASPVERNGSWEALCRIGIGFLGSSRTGWKERNERRKKKKSVKCERKKNGEQTFMTCR